MKRHDANIDKHSKGVGIYKKCVLLERLSAIAPRVIANRMYSQELIVRASHYFTTRACTIDSRIDYQFPSIRTLKREWRVSTLTWRVSILNEACFMRDVFDRANDDSQYFAKTVLGFMVSCMFCGHTFCFKNTAHCEIEFTISS